MATQLFFQGTLFPGIHLGGGGTKLNGSASGWYTYGFWTSRGGGAIQRSVASVTGPTPGVEAAFSGPPIDFITAPLSAAFTISGTITLNLWAFETNMTDNMAVNAIIERLDCKGQVISTIANTARVTELGTASAVNNFTVTPTSTSMLKGERIRVRVYFDDAGTMASGGSGAFVFSGTTAGSSGDSYITFTENLTFTGGGPSGTSFYLRDTASDVSAGTDERELSLSQGASQTTAVVDSVTGFTNPYQWTATAGGSVIEWYTKPLTGFTLAGLTYFHIIAATSQSDSLMGFRIELAICNSDGSSPVVWAANNIVMIFTPPPGQQVGGYNITGTLDTFGGGWDGWLIGQDTTLTNGQRLRVRLYADDASDGAMVSGRTATIYFNGTDLALNRSYMQLGQTVTEYSAPATLGPPIQHPNHGLGHLLGR